MNTLFANGRWGTNVFQLVACLMKYGLFKGFKFTKKGYADVKVGIILYDTGSSYHWATYYRDEKNPEKFRFLNIGSSYASKRYTIDEFLQNKVDGWLRYVIKVV